MKRRGVDATPQSLLVTAGSQQGIDLAARVLLEPGATVVVESPSYLAALQVFTAAEAKIVSVGSDDEGIDVDELSEVLERQAVRLIYLVPNFQNPRGTTLSLQRRHALVALAQKHRVPILEDDPYGELRFKGEALPALAGLDSELVLSLGTFSKTLLAPGLRLGLGARSHRADQTPHRRQAIDRICTRAPSPQRAVAELLQALRLPRAPVHILRATYGARAATAMLQALRQSDALEGTQLRRDRMAACSCGPSFPKELDAERLLAAAVKQKVAFVPGAPFFADHPRRNTLRLNFSNRPPELIAQGIERLGQVIQLHWKAT